MPINEPQFFDYHSGVLYQFTGTTPTSCEWHRVTPGIWGFDIERLSRYPNGWEFFGVEPVPGKWTWRLSIDRFPTTPSDLHGWLKQFDRFPDGFTDPNANCAISQSLESYVPILIRPNARIVPVNVATEPIVIKQTSSPCFCASECPLQTKPHRKYIVKILTPPFPFGYEEGKLYQIESADGDVCTWSTVPPAEEPLDEDLFKKDFTPTTGDHAYQWNLFLRLSPGEGIDYFTVKEWNESGQPNNPGEARCDVPTKLLEDGGSQEASIRGVPEWVCTTEDAREWDQKYPLPGF